MIVLSKFVRRVRDSSLIVRLLIAVMLGLGALIIRLFIDGALDPFPPYIVFYPAVLLSTILGGMVSGAVTAIVCVISADYLVPGLRETYGLAGGLSFLGTAALIIGLLEFADRAVRERTERGEKREAQLRQIFEQAPVAIAMFDRDMTYLGASARWLENFGLQRASTIGHHHYDLFPNLPEHWKEIHRRGLAGESIGEDFDSFRDHAGSSHYFRWQVQPWHTEAGTVGGIIIISEDLTGRIVSEQALQRSEQRLRLALDAAKMAVWEWDFTSGHIVWNDQHFRLLGYDPGSIEPSYEAWARRVLPEDLVKVEPKLQEATTTGNPYTAQYRVFGVDGRIRWLEGFGQMTKSESDPDGRMYGVLWDITAAKAAEAHSKLLLAEVNHRAKNLLAVVQSIADITAHESDPKTFAASFKARVRSLAACHDLLVRSEWHGTDLGDLIRSQVDFIDRPQSRRIEIQGPKLQINALAAQTIALAIHELSTNAVKYGALSCPQGRVLVQWDIEPTSAKCRLQWTEAGGPIPKTPEKSGFGSSVIKDNVEHALDAEVTVSYPPSGLAYRLSAPLEAIAEDGRDSEVSHAAAAR